MQLCISTLCMPGFHSLPSVKIYLLWETHLQVIVNVFLITLPFFVSTEVFNLKERLAFPWHQQPQLWGKHAIDFFGFLFADLSLTGVQNKDM